MAPYLSQLLIVSSGMILLEAKSKSNKKCVMQNQTTIFFFTLGGFEKQDEIWHNNNPNWKMIFHEEDTRQMKKLGKNVLNG